ncbi:calnexin-like isoform X2 [Asterias amurensis]|uniref:calnexin-like isoform X2 n=1 Tax=Asterias amurensis TaxID=7602 RepID=UPI003AB64B35
MSVYIHTCMFVGFNSIPSTLSTHLMHRATLAVSTIQIHEIGGFVPCPCENLSDLTINLRSLGYQGKTNKMKLSRCVIGMVLLWSSCLIHCQEEDGYDFDTDVEVEGETEMETVREKVVVQFTPPQVKGPTYFHEAFLQEALLGKRWVVSAAKKDGVDADLAKYDGKWAIEEPTDQPLQGDLGLTLKSKAKHHAVSAMLDKQVLFDEDPLIVQYEVKFQNGMECGGAYIKLLSHSVDLKLENVNDKTSYTIMFGPDKCGNDQKLHFIFRHKNPITGQFEEKHAKKPSGSFAHVFTDKKTHLFTLVVNPDNNFEIFVDQISVSSGNLLEDMTPPVNPPEEIDDPSDSKPDDWDDRKKIVDPDATKPDDWDEDAPATIIDEDATMPDGWLEHEQELIDDPDADKPEDWDDDMDGEWEPPKLKNPLCEDIGCGKWENPSIPNPDYKGKWKAPLIDNPAFRGEWKPQRISNPEYFEDMEPFRMTPIGMICLELWSMTEGIVFDNFIITSSRQVADDWASDTWRLKQKLEGVSGSAESVVSGLLGAAEDRPWLWAIYALVIIIPLFICFRVCFHKSSSDGVDSKKSDDVNTESGDGDDETQEGDKQEEGEGETEGSLRQRKRATKADLEQSTQQVSCSDERSCS